MPSSAARHRKPLTAQPCVRLFSDELLVDSGTFANSYEEVPAAVLELSFGGLLPDSDVERRAKYLLESFGAVELDCIEGLEPPVGSDANYLIQLEPDIHTLCSFSAYALPQLRAFGWEVVVDDEYPVHVVETSTPWFAEVTEDEEADWFSLELGTEIEGKRINLLPALLDLLDTTRATTLHGLSRTAKYIAVPVGDKQFLPVPREKLQSLLRVLLELYDKQSADGLLQFSNAHLPSLDNLHETFDEFGTTLAWSGDREVSRATRQANGATGDEVTPPQGLRATLRPYQSEGLAWLQKLRIDDVGGVLADDMGLGKTLQTISHLAKEKELGHCDLPSLVVAPTSLLYNWQRELGKFAPSLRSCVIHGPRRHEQWLRIPTSDVVITSYPLLVRDLEKLMEQEFHLLILDEAQLIKNSRSRTHKAVSSLTARHRLCLSGTPVENNLDELWSIFNFVNPTLLGARDAFTQRFRFPIEKRGDELRMKALRNRITPYVLRRTKDQVAKELPPKTELVRPVEISGKQRELYESIRLAAHSRVRSAIQTKGMAGSTIAILDALLKLRQVCCDPRLVSVPSARKVKESGKYETLFELLNQQLGHGRRVLIFSQFTSMLGLIGDGLRERGLGYSILTGSTADRRATCDEFESGKTDIFLISLKAGGTGLNLTSADTVVHYDPWWNPAAQAQATDRAYRIGQKRPVFVYNLIVAGSVEERILRLQQYKKELSMGLFGPDNRMKPSFTEDVVDDLLSPLA